jgi:hypothetical protein
METGEITIGSGILTCSCEATARNTPGEARRFLKRHPKLCSERRAFTKRLAGGTRSVDYDEWAEKRAAKEGSPNRGDFLRKLGPEEEL